MSSFPVVLLLTYLYYNIKLSICGDFQIDKYYLEPDSRIGLHKAIIKLKKVSLVYCATQCSSETECRCFLYGSTIASCILGLSYPSSNSNRTIFETQILYSKKHNCRLDMGYEIRAYGSTTRCIYISKEPVIYTDQCNKLGGRLIKTNSLELVRLVRNYAASMELQIGLHGILVGLNDKEKEGTYIWVDGQQLTPEQLAAIFKDNEPSNLPEEDCIAIKGYKLNDIQCDHLVYYACEMDLD